MVKPLGAFLRDHARAPLKAKGFSKKHRDFRLTVLNGDVALINFFSWRLGDCEVEFFLDAGIAPRTQFEWVRADPITGIEIDGHIIYLGTHGSASIPRAAASDATVAAAEERAAAEVSYSRYEGENGEFNAMLDYMYLEMVQNPESSEFEYIHGNLTSWCDNSPPLFNPAGGQALYAPGAACGANALSKWTAMVQQGGPWDHKPKLDEKFGLEEKNDYYTPIPGADGEMFYDVWSNVHYGYVGTLAGFDSSTLHGGASANDVIHNDVYDEGDRISVQLGIDLAKKYSPREITPARLYDAILGKYDELVKAGRILQD